jgi:hypothetical protein
MRIAVRLGLCTLCAVTTALHPAEKSTQTLCVADEKPLFSCRVDFNHVVGGKLLAGKKTVSVCASPDLSPSAGYLKYRFGRSQQNVELSYPADTGPPRQHFQFFRDSLSAKASAEQLSFSTGAFSYIVFVERAAYEWNGSGVLVKSRGKMIAYFPCDQDRPLPDRLYDLDGLGLPPAEYDDIQAELR